MNVPVIRVHENGPSLSQLVHGFWRLAEWNKSHRQLGELIEFSIEHGITTFDHADIYGGYTCEQLFGAVFAEMGIDRSDVQLVTKCGIKLISENRASHTIKCYDTSASHITASVENSLRALRTEYIDLLLIHRPDPLMDPQEVNRAFVALKESGKVRHFGVSNFLPSQFEMLAAALEVPLVTNQIEYSVMHLDAQADGTIDQCQRLHIRPMAWSPLGGGRLFHESSAQVLRLRETLGKVGREMGGCSADQVALAWILRHPVQFVPVLGTGNMSRISRSIDALDIALSREQWFEIHKAATGRDVA